MEIIANYIDYNKLNEGAIMREQINNLILFLIRFFYNSFSYKLIIFFTISKDGDSLKNNRV